MAKGLLIFAIVSYLLYKVGKYLFRFLFLIAGKEGNPHIRSSQQSRKRPTDGNVYIDKEPPKGSSNKNFNGGEYVDYEEL